MCFRTVDIKSLAQEKVNEWRKTSKRHEPYIHELAIMVSDVPSKYQRLLIEEILRFLE